MTYEPLEHTSPRQPQGQTQANIADPTLAVVVARLDDVRRDIDGLRSDLQRTTAANVPRGEWVQRNIHVDASFASQGREIAQLRADLAAKRMPWTAVAGALTGAVSLLVVLIQNIA